MFLFFTQMSVDNLNKVILARVPAARTRWLMFLLEKAKCWMFQFVLESD